MKRAMMFIFGTGLIVLWWFEVHLPDSSTGADIPGFNTARAWITWMDLLAGIGSLFGAVSLIMRGRVWATWLGFGTGILWLVGLTSGAPAWMSWWNFAFAIGFAAVASLGSRLGRKRSARPGQRELGLLVHEQRPRDAA